MVDAKIYIATNYPDFTQRANITELNLAGQNLTGELDFTNLGFINLQKIELQNNKLNKLILANPEQIDYLDIDNNEINDLRVMDGFVENYTRSMNYFNFINNPLTEDFKKILLKSRWDYYKQVAKFSPELVCPEVMQLVDINDLDEFVDNYDSSKDGSTEYKRIIGGGLNSLNEFGLQQLSQQVLARALVKQNELVNGKDEKYEEVILKLGREFQKRDSLYNQYDLDLIQREVRRKIKGEKDLEREFQEKILELEQLLYPNQSLHPKRAVNHEEIKNKIQELHETIARQRQDLDQLTQIIANETQTRQTLAQNYENSERARNSLQKISQELENKLSAAEINEQACRRKIEDLEKNNILEKEELNKIVNEREEYIQKLKIELAKWTDKTFADSETQTEKEPPNYWKWGLIGLVILIIILLFGFFWPRIKGYLFLN